MLNWTASGVITYGIRLFLKQIIQKIKYSIAIPIRVINDGMNAKNLIITKVIILSRIIIEIFCQFANFTNIHYR